MEQNFFPFRKLISDIVRHSCSQFDQFLSFSFYSIIAGAPLIIHPGRDDRAPFEIISILESAGASIDRTVMSHLDRTLQDKEKLLEFARMGCIMEYDHFGNEISHCQVSLITKVSINFGNRTLTLTFLSPSLRLSLHPYSTTVRLTC